MIAATSDPEVNHAIYSDAVAAGVLANAVDDPPFCDFYFGSVVRRGPLQIGISTAGESPALAQRLRQKLETLLDEGTGPWLERLGALRREVLAAHPAGEKRNELLRTLATREVCDAPYLPVAGDGAGNGKPGARVVVADMSVAEKGTVYLVGAGPGDPELLTLKAAALLRSADLVLHDDLVPAAVIAMAGGQALAVSVGKRCGVKHVHQSEIHTLMIDAARQRLSVVRLKSGDPLVFGRAAEEMDALRAAAVPFEVVPGITAAFAAAAQIGCSLTDRRSASSVELHTGHKAADIDQNAPAESTTRVVYMPGRNFRALAEERLAAGDAPEVPCCVISRAAQPDQSMQWSTLGELAEVVPGPAPVLLMTGWALAAAAARHAAKIANNDIASGDGAIATDSRAIDHRTISR